MVKVTLEEDGYKTIKHECGCAFACLIKPDEAPDGTNAIACLLGNVSIEDMAAGLSKCVLTIFDHMSDGDQVVKDAALYKFLCGIDEEYDNPAKDAEVIPFQTKISRT